MRPNEPVPPVIRMDLSLNMIVSEPARRCMKIGGTRGGYHTLLPPSMIIMFPAVASRRSGEPFGKGRGRGVSGNRCSPQAPALPRLRQGPACSRELRGMALRTFGRTRNRRTINRPFGSGLRVDMPSHFCFIRRNQPARWSSIWQAPIARRELRSSRIAGAVCLLERSRFDGQAMIDRMLAIRSQWMDRAARSCPITRNRAFVAAQMPSPR